MGARALAGFSKSGRIQLVVDFDDDAAVIAGSPALRVVEGSNADLVGQVRGGEDEVELSCRGPWGLARVVERGYAQTVRGQFSGPGCGLAAVRSLGPDEAEAERFRAGDHGVVAGLPVRVAVFAVAVEQVPVPGHGQPDPSVHRQHRQVGQSAGAEPSAYPREPTSPTPHTPKRQ